MNSAWQLPDKLMFLHLSGLISFGAANDLVRRFTVLSGYEVLIIDLLDVPRVDGSAIRPRGTVPLLPRVAKRSGAFRCFEAAPRP